MSVRVMTAVWELNLSDSEKIVLLALADCANDEGHCWPSMATLARKCSKTDRTVQAAIKSLVDAGHLTRREVPGKGCNYTVHPRNNFTPEATSPRKDYPPKGTTPTPEAASDKPSRTITSEAKASSVKRRKSEFEVPDWIPAEPWAAYCAMRARKKAPVDSYIAGKQFRKLESIKAAGWDIAKVLDKATVNNWTDIFPPTPGRDDDMRATGSQSSAKPSIAGGSLFDQLREGKITEAEFHAERAKLAQAEKPPPRRDKPQTGSIAQFIPRIAGAA